MFEIQQGLPEKKEFDVYSIFDRDYRLNISFVMPKTYELPPISKGGSKRKDFSISGPLCAYGIDDGLLGTNISDPDGWKK